MVPDPESTPTTRIPSVGEDDASRKPTERLPSVAVMETVRIPASAAPSLPVARKGRRGAILAALAVALVLVLTVTGITLIHPRTSITTPQAAATATATAIPTATSTPLPPISLGLTNEQYVVRLGQPTEVFADGLSYNATIGGIGLFIHYNLVAGQDGQPHTGSLRIAPQTSWTPQQATTALEQFLPGDAVYQKDVIVKGVVYHIFTSASMATLLPPAQFTTYSRTTNAPGTFTAFCSAILDACYLDTHTPDIA